MPKTKQVCLFSESSLVKGKYDGKISQWQQGNEGNEMNLKVVKIYFKPTVILLALFIEACLDTVNKHTCIHANCTEE